MKQILQTRRAIIYTFNFTVKGYIYGPVTNKSLITRTKVDVFEPSTANTEAYEAERITLTQGLLANGS